MAMPDQSATLQWIASNALSAGWVAAFLFAFGCVSVFAYKFIGAYAPIWGSRMAAQHADLRRAITSYKALDGILNRLLGRLNATRVGLFRFHDNARDASQMPFFFASIANMVGVSLDFAKLTNLPLAVFAPVLDVIADGGVWMSKVDTLPACGLRELYVAKSTDTFLFAPVFDLDGHLIGMVSVTWGASEKVPKDVLVSEIDHVLSAEVIREIRSVTYQICGYFSLRSLDDPKR
jgi:hypothetical protein